MEPHFIPLGKLQNGCEHSGCSWLRQIADTELAERQEESYCVTKQWMDSEQFWGLETLKMENLIFIGSAGTSGNNTLVLHNHVSKGRLKTFVLFV